jgi:cytochrome d ubiquinol oxidase subunit I
VPLVLFAWPDEAAAREPLRDRGAQRRQPDPQAFSLDGVVPGLNDYIGNHPPVAPVFWGFRIMVGVGHR